MSARGDGTMRGDGAHVWEASARVNPSAKVISGPRSVYPLLMIGGVYRMSFAMGLAVYALPSLPVSARMSRHRARVSVRRARYALRQNLTPSGADVSPRDHQP